MGWAASAQTTKHTQSTIPGYYTAGLAQATAQRQGHFTVRPHVPGCSSPPVRPGPPPAHSAGSRIRSVHPRVGSRARSWSKSSSSTPRRSAAATFGQQCADIADSTINKQALPNKLRDKQTSKQTQTNARLAADTRLKFSELSTRGKLCQSGGTSAKIWCTTRNGPGCVSEPPPASPSLSGPS